MHLLLTALFPKQIIFEKMGSWYEQIRKNLHYTRLLPHKFNFFLVKWCMRRRVIINANKFLMIPNCLLLQSTWLFILTILNPLYPRICQVWLKLANSVTEKKIKNLMYKLYRRMDRLWHPIKSDHKSSLEVWQFRWAKYITVTVTYSTVTKRCKK